MHGTKLLVGQSGGPTAVINSSLAGVIKSATDQGIQVLGMINGLQGYLEGRKMDLSSLSKEELSLLKTTPGAYLGSCRFKLPEDLDDYLYQEVFNALERDDIGYVLYIGGNDSMDTLDKLSRYAKAHHIGTVFVGIPKTIDNDLVGTDHAPGYGSAAKFVASTVRQIVQDIEVYRVDAVTIVEIMGREAGWLTAASALARRFEGDNPVRIYMPEVDFDPERMLSDIQMLLKEEHGIVICVSEGIHDSHGRLICEADDTAVDVFGHKQLSGCGKALENLIRARLGIKVRSVELNIPQRSNAIEASLVDVEEAYACGAEAVKRALSEESGVMVSLARKEEEPYACTLETVPLSKVSNGERLFPEEWILKGDIGFDPAFEAYVKPLIQGESRPPMEEGLPKFIYRKASTHK